MTSQTPDDIEIGYSTMRMLKLIVLGIGMTMLCAAIALNWFGEKETDSFHVVMGYAGLLLFGLGTCKFTWTWLSTHGPILCVSRYGFRDLRIADEFIRSSAIEGISTWEYRQKSIVLAMTPELEHHLFAGAGKKAMLLANRALGVNGLSIGAAGLDIDIDTLLRICQDYYSAAKSESALRSQAITASPETTGNGAEHSLMLTPAVRRSS